MPRVKNEVKKIEMKLYLSPNAKQKLSMLAIKSKTNQSALIERLILDFDVNNQVAENVSYITEKEKIFTELAGYISDLSESQEKLFGSINDISKKLLQIECVVEIQTKAQEHNTRQNDKIINMVAGKSTGIFDEVKKVFGG